MSGGAAAAGADRAAAPWTVVAWWSLCGLVAAAGAWFALIKIVDHDVAYWIVASERLLGGQRLYRDLIELNPPVNYVLSIVMFLIARALALDPILTFHAFVVSLAIAMTALTAYAARRVLDAGDAFARLIALPVLFSFLIIPGPDLGQREHLLAMVLLPYLVIVAGRDPLRLHRPVRLAIGAMAGFVVAFKPFFAAYLAAAEAIVLWRSRDPRLLLRAEPLAAIVVIAAAAAATVVAYPEYLGVIVPLGRAIYQGFEESLWDVMAEPPVAATILLSGAAVLIAAHLPRKAVRDLVLVLAAFAAMALIVFIVQRKGWRYHALPALIFATIGIGSVLVELIRSDLSRHGRAALALGLAAITVASATIVTLQTWLADNRQRAAEIEPLVALVASTTPRRALFLSTHLPNTFPVVNYAGASWPYRYHHLLPLPGLYRDFDPAAAGGPFRHPAEMGAIEASFFAAVVDDARRFPPQLILVDRRPQYATLDEIGFDFLAYFRQDPEFARLSDRFRYAGRVSGQDVYVRAD